MTVLDAVLEEALKLIRRHQRYAADLDDEIRRIERRASARPSKTVQVPGYWSIDRGFDPYYVRAHAGSIAYAIERALRRGDYCPRPAIAFEVPKNDGTMRTVSVFQVADNAISRLVFKQLLAKNSSRLSAHCYAYRTDLTLHDAVLDIASDFRGRKRLFVAEFDFRKYFDNIAHDHIANLLKGGDFFISDSELRVLRAFLEVPTLSTSSYLDGGTAGRERGIPQGTSVSLFLANIAARPLDRSLERMGVGFARFADDTLIWSDDYAALCGAVVALEGASAEMGVAINLEKSAGISILAPEGAPREFKGKEAVDFVGHRISTDCVGITGRAIARIKKRIAYIIFSNLIQQPKRGVVVASRIAPPVDRDYVVMCAQIRRYLYGNLSERQLRLYLAKGAPRIRYRGLMSFYPIVNDEALLRSLDGWLLHTVVTSLAIRGRLFRGRGLVDLPKPHGLTKREALDFIAQSSKGARLDLRLPSFARVAKLIRASSAVYGANAVANQKTLYGAGAGVDGPGYRRTI